MELKSHLPIERQARVISKEALQKRLEDWQKQMTELQSTFLEYNKELERKQKNLTDPIVEKVQGAIKRMAKYSSGFSDKPASCKNVLRF